MLNKSGNKTFTRKEGSNGVFITSLAKKKRKRKERLARWGGLAFEMTPTHHGLPGQGDKRIKETTQTAETLVEYQQGAKDRSLCVIHTAVYSSKQPWEPTNHNSSNTHTHTERARKRKEKKRDKTNGV